MRFAALAAAGRRQPPASVVRASTGGALAGTFIDASGAQHGFVEIGDVFHTLDDPAATDFTNAGSINDAGLVVDDAGYGPLDRFGSHDHGFLATPVPEPDVWTMLLVGFVAATVSRLRVATARNRVTGSLGCGVMLRPAAPRAELLRRVER